MAIHPSTDTELITLVGTSHLPIVADFWAVWCEGCKSLTMNLHSMSTAYKDRLLFRTIDVDKNPLVTGKFSVMSLPTVIVFKGGYPIDKLVGSVSVTTIKTFLERHSNGY